MSSTLARNLLREFTNWRPNLFNESNPKVSIARRHQG
jgi:hypothetical protein